MPSSLNNTSPRRALGSSPHPPVSVYGTGPYGTIAAFLDSKGPRLRYFISLRITPSSFMGRICRSQNYFACTGLSIPGSASLPVSPAVLSIRGCRNLNLLSIGYAFLPLLRPRLTQGRSALPWKPWIFGLKDSHLHLATHSGILSP